MRWYKKIDWIVFPFFVLTTLIAVVGLSIYIPRYGIHPLEPILTAVFVFVVAMVIAAGYHRLFSHRSYQCHPLLKALFLIVGSTAFQQSALKWSSDHRLHHRYVDSEKDPYSIKKGLWWAHIGWVFAKDPPGWEKRMTNVSDLQKDRWVRWQHRHWFWLGGLLSVAIPLMIGFLIGRPMGMLLWAGFLRVVISHQTTFTVNSLAHKFGRQPYSDRDSSRDVWWLAPFLCGEAYHNYHHSFQSDYRNGIRWYHWDPAKWAIWLGSHTPLVTHLHRTPSYLVVRARAEMDFKRLKDKMNRIPSEFWLPLQERLLKLRQGLEEAALQFTQAKRNYLEFRKNVAERSRESLKTAQESLRETEQAFQQKWELWRKTIRQLGRGFVPAWETVSAI